MQSIKVKVEGDIFSTILTITQFHNEERRSRPRESLAMSQTIVKAVKFWAIAIFIVCGYILFVQAPGTSSTSKRVGTPVEAPRPLTPHNVIASAATSFFPPSGYDVVGNDEEAATVALSYTNKLIPKYKDELKLLIKNGFLHAKEARAIGLSMNPPIVCKGQIGTVEMSFLYMLIRETKPSNVLEVGALCGWSTYIMLKALEMNGSGHLTTFDLHDYAPQFIGVQSKWTFHATDVMAFQQKDANYVNKFDVLFIDAVHDNVFAEVYTRSLLRNIARDTPVFVHDIFSPFQIVNFKPCQRKFRVFK